MDLKGSLVDTNVRIYPSQKLKDYIKTISIDRATPYNVAKLAKGEDFVSKNKTESVLNPKHYALNTKDVENITEIRSILKSEDTEDELSKKEKEEKSKMVKEIDNEKENIKPNVDKDDKKSVNQRNSNKSDLQNENDKSDSQNVDGQKDNEKSNAEKESVTPDKETDNTDKSQIQMDEQYLVTTDIDWLYEHLKEKRNKGNKDVPFLHVLLEGVDVVMPDNKLIKRNPILEERCVKLRAQQEAREYRKMTKSVDNVRIRFPEDSISYQLKQLNRQLIGIGQFILSIFAGFLFGFKGVEWMIGHLDFGFRLLLGVMCALIIALAEIYFLAKKLNEELNIPETIQLGGPTKFAEEPTCHGHKISKLEKEHMD